MGCEGLLVQAEILARWTDWPPRREIKSMSVNKAAVNRPISPHLTIYKPQISSVPSITHRITGVGLGVGTIWLAWWLIAAASGPDAFAIVQTFSGSIIGRLLLLGFTWALCFHFINGIRHLIWDLGFGFDLKSMELGGWITVYGSVILTAIVWVAGYMMRGAV
jgi:succinate dehydrogenase / fumarate reductase cytochrome b subunit